MLEEISYFKDIEVPLMDKTAALEAMRYDTQISNINWMPESFIEFSESGDLVDENGDYYNEFASDVPTYGWYALDEGATVEARVLLDPLVICIPRGLSYGTRHEIAKRQLKMRLDEITIAAVADIK